MESNVHIVPQKQTNSLMSEKLENLALALSKAQASIENVSKDNQGYGYKYADLAACLEAIKRPLADNGLCVTQLVSTEEGKPILITLLLHQSGEWLKSVFPIENVTMKQGNSVQHFGAGLTYCRRYALSAIVGLTQKDENEQLIVKNTVQEKVEKDFNLVQQLLNQCLKCDIDAKEFAIFHNVDSKKPETVKYAIDNFNLLKEQFLNARNETTH